MSEQQSEQQYNTVGDVQASAEVVAKLGDNQIKIPAPRDFISFLREKNIQKVTLDLIQPRDNVSVEGDQIKIGDRKIPTQDLMYALGRGVGVDKRLLRWDYENTYIDKYTREERTVRIYQIPLWDQRSNSVKILRLRQEEYNSLLDKLFGKDRIRSSTAIKKEEVSTLHGKKELQSTERKVQISDGVIERVVEIQHASSLGAREVDEDYTGDIAFRIPGDPNNDVLYFVGLADGMGGHMAGDKASKLAIETAIDILTKPVTIKGKSTPRLKYEEGQYLIYNPQSKQWEQLGNDLKGDAGDKLMKIIAKEANDQVYKWNKRKKQDSGTTFVGALIVGGDTLKIVNVGDSRAYIQGKSGGLHQVTKDHSLVQRLIDIEQLTPESASSHPKRNIIYRSLGSRSTVEADVYTRGLNPGTKLLLVCDGPPEALGEEYLPAGQSPQRMASLASEGAVSLVKESIKSQDCKDNCSAITVSYERNKPRVFATPQEAVDVLGKEMSNLAHSINQPDWEDRQEGLRSLLTQLSEMKGQISGEDKQKYALLIKEFAGLIRDLKAKKD